jgi:arylsulfatase
MSGKWHLGSTPESNPNQKGFEKSFVLLDGYANHYNSEKGGNTQANYTENGEPTIWKEGNYSTDFYTDKIIEFIDGNKDDGKPFFAFVAYTSPHWPLQVDKRYSEKYKGLYDDGYEKLKQIRFENLKKNGIIGRDAVLPPNRDDILPWDSLSEEDKRKESRKMELYAGMVDNLDYNIGRLINYLNENNMNENSLIVFISDNGAAALDSNNDNYKLEQMGTPNSFVAYGPQWAEAGSAPFKYFKTYATEGGINTTMIINGSGVNRKNELHHGFTSLLDLAPTFYELAGVTYPKSYMEHELYPLKGESLVPFISGRKNEIHDSDYIFAIEHYGYAMLRKGNWKITNSPPFNEDNFRLYNLSIDLAEGNDLKKFEPEKYQELINEWGKFTDEIKFKDPIGPKLKTIIDTKGIDFGVQRYWELKKTDADMFNFGERELNILGYTYLGNEEVEKAIAVLKLNIKVYPNSFNVYNSYAEALLKSGDKERAIENYIKSVELHPRNENGIKVLNELGVTTDHLTKKISVDDHILQSYVGRYELRPNFVITVSKDGNQMKAEATGQGESDIYPISENVFYLKVVEAQLTFNLNDNGQVESVTLLQGGNETTGMKLKD